MQSYLNDQANISQLATKMNRHTYIMTVLVWAVFHGITACSNLSGNKSPDANLIADTGAASINEASSAALDSLTPQLEALTAIYTQAIAEFIKATYKKDKTTFDTLYFGKHVYGQPDDFPNIELPQTIEGTQIRLVAPAVGQKKQAERKSLFYVNMMGWVDNEEAAFILVVFTNGGEHQYDYFINFTAENATNKFELYTIAFENYVYLNGEKPTRVTLYKDGKYVEDK